MIFLDFRNDYLKRLAPERLAELLSLNPLDEAEALTDIEAMAVSTLVSHLEERYDLRALKGKKYRESQQLMKSWMVCIAIHLLYEQAGIRPDEEFRNEYKACMTRLRAIKEGRETLLAPTPKRKAGSNWLDNHHSQWDLESPDFEQLF